MMHDELAVRTEVLPIGAISERYGGEWLLIKILDASLPMGDAPGIVLAHGPDRNGMFKAERKARKHDPRALLTVLQAGERFGDGETLRQELTRAAEEEFVSVNNW